MSFCSEYVVTRRSYSKVDCWNRVKMINNVFSSSLEILQFKSEHSSFDEKSEEQKKQVNKSEKVASNRNHYKFDTDIIKEDDKIPEIKDYGYVFR